MDNWMKCEGPGAEVPSCGDGKCMGLEIFTCLEDCAVPMKDEICKCASDNGMCSGTCDALGGDVGSECQELYFAGVCGGLMDTTTPYSQYCAGTNYCGHGCSSSGTHAAMLPEEYHETCEAQHMCSITTAEDCEAACLQLGNHFRSASWNHSPGCYMVMEGQWAGSCHWNTNTDPNLQWRDERNSGVCRTNSDTTAHPT